MACIVLQNAGPSAGESGPEGTCEPFVQAYRSASKYKEVRNWPGGRIPARDAIWGEKRNAFPVDVPAGRAQAIFVESCAPLGAGPARLAGSVKLTWHGGGLDVPVEVKVRAFDLPPTPALATAF